METLTSLPLGSYITRLILVTFATYVIGHGIAQEPGLFAVYQNLREFCLKRFKNKDGSDHWLNEMMRCPRCQSYWLAFIMAGVFFPQPSLLAYIFTALAIGGVAFLYHFILLALASIG